MFLFNESNGTLPVGKVLKECSDEELLRSITRFHDFIGDLYSEEAKEEILETRTLNDNPNIPTHIRTVLELALTAYCTALSSWVYAAKLIHNDVAKELAQRGIEYDNPYIEFV